MTKTKGKGSTTAKRANANVAVEGKSMLCKSSLAQAEIGEKGGTSKS